MIKLDEIKQRLKTMSITHSDMVWLIEQLRIAEARLKKCKEQRDKYMKMSYMRSRDGMWFKFVDGEEKELGEIK